MSSRGWGDGFFFAGRPVGCVSTRSGPRLRTSAPPSITGSRSSLPRSPARLLASGSRIPARMDETGSATPIRLRPPSRRRLASAPSVCASGLDGETRLPGPVPPHADDDNAAPCRRPALRPLALALVPAPGISTPSISPQQPRPRRPPPPLGHARPLLTPLGHPLQRHPSPLRPRVLPRPPSTSRTITQTGSLSYPPLP